MNRGFKQWLLLGSVWVLSIVATGFALRYGLPPKEGSMLKSCLLLPIAFFWFLVTHDDFVGGFLALFQFTLLAAIITFYWRRGRFIRGLVVVLTVYLIFVAMSLGVVRIFHVTEMTLKK